jgi:hypothetical protein
VIEKNETEVVVRLSLASRNGFLILRSCDMGGFTRCS